MWSGREEGAREITRLTKSSFVRESDDGIPLGHFRFGFGSSLDQVALKERGSASSVLSLASSFEMHREDKDPSLAHLEHACQSLLTSLPLSFGRCLDGRRRSRSRFGSSDDDLGSGLVRESRSEQRRSAQFWGRVKRITGSP